MSVVANSTGAFLALRPVSVYILPNGFKLPFLDIAYRLLSFFMSIGSLSIVIPQSIAPSFSYLDIFFSPYISALRLYSKLKVDWFNLISANLVAKELYSLGVCAKLLNTFANLTFLIRGFSPDIASLVILSLIHS